MGSLSLLHTYNIQLYVCVYTYMTEWLSTCQSCLCNPMDCSPPGASVHGILQASVLEWIAIPFSRGSSQLRDWTWVSCAAGRFFYIYIYMYIFSFRFFPLYVRIRYWAEFPVVYTTSCWLSSLYIAVYILISKLLIYRPPFHNHLWEPSVCFLCLWVFLFCR